MALSQSGHASVTRQPPRPGPPSAEEQFKAAVAAHQQGRLAEAEGLYRRLLRAEPEHAGALHYLGVVALQRGEAAQAADLIGRSLARRERNAEGHYHLGLALAALGRFAETLAHNERAVALQPGYAEAHMNRGNALKALGRLAAAEGAYARTIALAPAFAEAHFNLGNVLGDLGRLDEALAAYERALQVRPAYPEALNNSAAALLMRGRTAEALARYRQALGLRPDFTEAMVGQALALLAAEDHFGALALVTRALAVRPSDEARHVFLGLARALNACPDIPRLREVLATAIAEAWARPRLFARFAGVVLGASGPVADLVNRAQDELLTPAALETLASDPLLRALMDATSVADLRLERMLTAARRRLLALRDDGDTEQVLDFACALARQCFINEYVFAETDEESAEVAALSEALAAACGADAPVAPLRVALVAAYRPLAGIPDSARLVARAWPDPVERLLTQQVREPLAEARLRESIPRLTGIADAVSVAVRRQYEENPYPRWVRATQGYRPVPIDLHLRRQLPAAPFAPLGKAEVEILAAGCGTGQHHIEFAHAIAHARILAVDLSLASLAYARRMSDALGLASIDYGQADILELPALERSFDVIVAGGVLHHMADPFAAWRQLLRLLRPGGVMNLGLYSALARADVVAARAFIAGNGFAADADGIRRARAAIARMPADAPMRRLTRSADFYSMSECRDLLFHVQEHRLALPEIHRFLGETGLRFLGFELGRDVLARYAARFPEDRTLTDLLSWDAFEREHPRTFLGMYQFWVQKPPVPSTGA